MIKLSRRELKQELKDTPIEAILGTHVSRTLTGKQKAFALEVAKGQTKADAYRKAYKPDASKHTMASKPYELARDDRIQREIKAYELAIEASKHRTPAALRELVISGLVEVALNPDTKDAVRVQALRTIGTITEVSAFTERKEVRTISSSETAKASILAQLQTLMQGEITDVTSRDAESLLNELKGSDVATLPDAPHDHVATLPDVSEEPVSHGATYDGENVEDADPTHRGEAAVGFGSPTA